MWIDQRGDEIWIRDCDYVSALTEELKKKFQNITRCPFRYVIKFPRYPQYNEIVQYLKDNHGVK